MSEKTDLYSLHSDLIIRAKTQSLPKQTFVIFARSLSVLNLVVKGGWQWLLTGTYATHLKLCTEA